MLFFTSFDLLSDRLTGSSDSGTVPWMMFLNGKRRTHFAGAWTILSE